MKKILFCLTLLSLGGLTFTACSSTATSRSTGTYIDDASVTTRVKAAFVKDEIVKALDVNVETYNGAVQLSGFVESQQQKQRAEQIARGIQGVREVTNNIQMANPAPAR